MSAQISAARLEANRRNAQLGTGPRTPQGKARSSRNAITHGLLSKSGPQYPIPDAATGPVTHDDHAALIAAFTADLRPANTLETSLVADLSSLRHRLNRLTAIESGLFEKSLHNAIQFHPEHAGPGQKTVEDCLAAPSPMHLAGAFEWTSRQLNLLSFYETRLKRDFHRTLAELRRTQDLRMAAESAPESDRQAPVLPGNALQAREAPHVKDTKEAAPAADAAALHATPRKEQTNPTSLQPPEITTSCVLHPPSPSEAVIAGVGKPPAAATGPGSLLENNGHAVGSAPGRS